jgi:hypothetical protein
VKRALLTCLLTANAWAQPDAVVYQGALMDDGGQPVDATVDLYFKIYSTATGGAPSWEQDVLGVVVERGLFTVELALSAADLPQDDLWLGVAVNDEAQEMAPRPRVAWAPWAYLCDDTGALGTLAAAQAQRRVTGGCSGGDAIRAVNADGSVDCEPDDTGSGGAVTSLSAGTGLDGNVTTGNVILDVTAGDGLTVASDVLAAAFAGPGSLGSVARSDHGHGAAYFADGGFTSCGVDDKAYGLDPGTGDVLCTFDQRYTYFPGTNLQMLAGNQLDTANDLFLPPGGLTLAGSYAFTFPRSGYTMIHPVEFNTHDSGDTGYFASASAGSANAGGAVNITAAIDVPDLVHVSSVTVFFYEEIESDDLVCTFDVIDRLTGNFTSPGGATGTCPGFACGVTNSTILPDVIVDNSRYAYVARCFMFSTNNPGFVNIQLYGYRIAYEMTEIRR